MTTPADAPDIIAKLDALPAERAADIVQAGISSALQAHDVEAAAGLLATMCRYAPRRAAELHRTLLDACRGRITITLPVHGTEEEAP